MAKSSKKTFWLITAVILVVMIQLVVIGFIVANVFSQTETPRKSVVQNQPNVQRNYTPPTAKQIRRSPSSQPIKATGPKPKPTGPRAEPPQFSKTGGVYTNTVAVQLTAKNANAVIRYTLDGSEPNEQSAAYSAPIAIQQTTLLRAACFQPGLAPSVAAAQAYTMLGSDLLGFSSNLPLIIINTFNQPISSQDYYSASVRFIDVADGRASLDGRADFDGTTDLKRRGFSSLRYPKMSFTLKTRDDDGEKEKAAIFGMPAESDWVLYGPYVDKTMMRDVLGYELSNQMGRYAPRTRFVEVFVHRSAGKLTYRDYAGVYVLTEKIKRGKERVNITKLKPEDNKEPEISGGYILKRDHGAMSGGGGRGGWGGPPRPSDDGKGFITPHRLHLFYVEPDEDELTAAQKNWVTKYMADFERSLYGGNFTSPTEGYAKYLDVDAFIDHFWLIELSKNVDGFRYSAFLYKPRGGKITMGPAWDWNLSFGNADYYDGNETSGWYYDNLREIEISWIYRLKQDPDFMQRAADRWTELRRDVLATDRILRRVDAMSAQIQDAQARNFRRWPVMGRQISPNYYVGPTFDAEVNWMKGWIRDRMTWIDRQFPRAPILAEKPGRVVAGTKLNLRADGGDIFYTLDGTDPRASGGAKANAALQYKGPIAVGKETRLVARVRRGNAWSGPTTGTFTSAP